MEKKVKYKTGVKEGTKHCYHGNTEVKMRISGPLPLTPPNSFPFSTYLAWPKVSGNLMPLRNLDLDRGGRHSGLLGLKVRLRSGRQVGGFQQNYPWVFPTPLDSGTNQCQPVHRPSLLL